MHRKKNIIKEGKITTEKEEIKEFFSEFEKLTIAIEAYTTWEHIFETLETDRHQIALAHPLKTRIIAEARVKTDKVDAKIPHASSPHQFSPYTLYPL